MRKTLFVLMCLMPVAVFAQELQPPDLNAAALSAITALTPVATMLLVWGLKFLWQKIPASAIFIVTPVVGAAINYGLLWYDGNVGAFSPVVGAALGWLAIALREFLDTLQTKGLNGSVSLTARKL